MNRTAKLPLARFGISHSPGTIPLARQVTCKPALHQAATPVKRDPIIQARLDPVASSETDQFGKLACREATALRSLAHEAHRVP